MIIMSRMKHLKVVTYYIWLSLVLLSAFLYLMNLIYTAVQNT